MSVSVAALPAKTLAKLKDGPTICIQRKRTPTSEPEILDSFYPKGIATAFSSKWSALFPPVNQIAVGSMHKAHPTTLTIVGGNLASNKLVLSWMKTCCKGAGLHPFQHVPRADKPFYHYYLLKEAAEIIGCTYLEKKLGERMEALADTQIHSEDVRALWIELPEGHELRRYLAQHVATLTWNRELKAFPAYVTLREELSDFDAAINAILDPKSEERRQQRRAERNEFFQKQREEERKKANQGRKKKEKQAASNVSFAEKVAQPAEAQEDISIKKPVPGANDITTIPFFKNKAAKRRHKKREEKANDSSD